MVTAVRSLGDRQPTKLAGPHDDDVVEKTALFQISYGTDPLAPAGSFGLAEFIVSAGSKIVNERFVTNANLGVWVVPEPALMGPGILAVFVVLLLRRSYRRVRQPLTSGRATGV